MFLKFENEFKILLLSLLLIIIFSIMYLGMAKNHFMNSKYFIHSNDQIFYTNEIKVDPLLNKIEFIDHWNRHIVIYNSFVIQTNSELLNE